MSVRILAGGSSQIARTLGCWHNPHWKPWMSRRDMTEPQKPATWNFTAAPELAVVLQGELVVQKLSDLLAKQHDVILFEKGLLDCRVRLLSPVIKIFTEHQPEIDRVLKVLKEQQKGRCPPTNTCPRCKVSWPSWMQTTTCPRCAVCQ